MNKKEINQALENIVNFVLTDQKENLELAKMLVKSQELQNELPPFINSILKKNMILIKEIQDKRKTQGANINKKGDSRSNFSIMGLLFDLSKEQAELNNKNSLLITFLSDCMDEKRSNKYSLDNRKQ